MKPLISVLMIILLIGTICGCAGGKDISTPVNFYYCTDPIAYNDVHGVISPEIREGDGYGEDLKALLDLYLLGPVTDGLRSPFPGNVYVESITQVDLTVHIRLSEGFSQLNGNGLTLACTSMSMTLFDLTQCETVRIAVPQTQPDGSEYIEITRESLLLIDEYTAVNDDREDS